ILFMRKSMLSVALSGMMALTIALTGCGGAQQTQKPAENTPAAQPQQPAAEPAKSGAKQLIVGRGGDSVGLDPITVTDGESFKVTENIFDTLVGFEETNTNVVP
ncbi:hypothetical protein MXD81_16880, partial [Microbacteriaceae bacterium K1510]|nr:hypothetical protein [Microbacteriaceae bacterium K1510]